MTDAPVPFVNLQDGTIRFPDGPPIGHVRNVRHTDDGGLEFEMVFTKDGGPCVECNGTGRTNYTLFDELINNGVCTGCDGTGWVAADTLTQPPCQHPTKP